MTVFPWYRTPRQGCPRDSTPLIDGPAAGPLVPYGKNYAAPFATGPSPVRTGAERRGRR
ncbi:hypothetical protein TPA0598_02_02040 [Streptomyces lydicamycinicus]|uniref:Uncharacterized protein n=1 Tax=Streptomyces lydicamycinicus TaxID=1546107 RepID=A0A0P4R299_9ACTN|nr:hypothetical protein TPA0598_02_02040 [Streptomyces lydicamycinicus]